MSQNQDEEIQPTDKLSYQFAVVRNQLDHNNIPYQLLIGYDEVMQLMNDKINKNIIIINNSQMIRPEFVKKKIFNVYGNEIYFYPNKHDDYGHLSNINNIINLYKSYNGEEPINKKIILRSIKKDLQKSRDKNYQQQMYKKISILKPKGYNHQYQLLFQILQLYKNVAIPISGESQAQHHGEGKSLLIIQKDAFVDVSKFLISNQQKNNIDLAVLGFVKGFDKRKNYAIMTQYPTQIIQYLNQAGIVLPGAKQKYLIMKANEKNNSNLSNKNIHKQVEVIQQANLPSFSPNTFYLHENKQEGADNGRRENGGQMGKEVSNQKNINEKVQLGHTMPLTSRISQSSGIKQRRSIKKVKKLGGSSDAGSTIKQNTQQNKKAKLKLTQQQDQIQKVNLKYQIHFDTNSSNDNNYQKQKQYVHYDHHLQQIFVNQNGSNNANQNAHNKENKLVMNWEIYPNHNQKSLYNNGPSFVIQPQQNKINTNPITQNNNTNNTKQKQQQQQKRASSINQSHQQQQKNSDVMINKNNQSINQKPIVNIIPQRTSINVNKIPSRPPLPPTLPNATNSFQFIQQSNELLNSNTNFIMTEPIESNNKDKIQQKYQQPNLIKEVSEEYRGSNLSYPFDQNAQKLMGNTPINSIKTASNKFSKSQPASSKFTSNKSIQPCYSQIKNQNNIGNDNILPQIQQIKKPSICQQDNLNQIQQNKQIINLINNQSQLKKQFKKQFQTAKYQCQYSNTTPIQIVNDHLFNYQNGSDGNNQQNTTKIVKHQINTPQTFYQQPSKISAPRQSITGQNNSKIQERRFSQPPSQIKMNAEGPIQINQNNKTSIAPNETISLPDNTSINPIPITTITNNNNNEIINAENNKQIKSPTNVQTNTEFAPKIIKTEQKQTILNNTSPNNTNNITINNQPLKKMSTFPTTNQNYSTRQSTKYQQIRTSTTQPLIHTPTILQSKLPQTASPFQTFNPIKNKQINNQSNPTNTVKNYMNTLGFNQEQYQIIIDNNGRKIYRLKSSNNYNNNYQMLEKVKSVPRISSNVGSIGTTGTLSPQPKIAFNYDDYDQHVDEKGKKYYTLKKNGNNIINSSTKKSDLPSPTTPNSQQLPLQSNPPSRVQQITKDFHSQQQSLYNKTKQNTPNNLPQKSQTTQLPPPIKNQYNTRQYNTYSTSSTSNMYNPSFPYGANRNHVITEETTEVVERRRSNVDRCFNAFNQRNSKVNNFDHNYNNRVSMNQNTSPNNYNMKSREYQQQNRPKSKITTLQQYERRVDKNGKTYEINKRQEISQLGIKKQLKQISKQPNYLKQIYTMKKQQTIPQNNNNKKRSSRIQEINKYQYKQIKSNNIKSSNSSKIDSHYGIKNSQIYNMQISSKGSLLTDSRAPSASKILNAYLHGDSKSYLTSFTNPDLRVESMDELIKLNHELKDFQIRGNPAHFIVDTSHPLRYAIEKKADAGDNIVEIDIPDKIYEYMSKKPLPQQLFDIGFIFIQRRSQKQINPKSIMQGYYLVDVDNSNPEIQIKRQKKIIYISNPQNIDLIRKLLLAPLIQHYILYPKESQKEIQKILNLFPQNKYEKHSYTNYTNLQDILTKYSKNRGRFIRILIFVNMNNIAEISSIMSSHFNRKNFNMICHTNHPVSENVKYQFNRVAFSNNFDFNSYGSVINLTNNLHNNNNNSRINNNDYPINCMDNYTIKYQQTQKPTIAHPSQKQISSHPDIRPKIYIQHPHIGISQQIQHNLPGIYQIKIFDNIKQIMQRSRDNFILLHRDADNIGVQFDRNLGTVIMLGGKKGDRIPSGTVSIRDINQLIQNIL